MVNCSPFPNILVKTVSQYYKESSLHISTSLPDGKVCKTRHLTSTKPLYHMSMYCLFWKWISRYYAYVQGTEILNIVDSINYAINHITFKLVKFMLIKQLQCVQGPIEMNLGSLCPLYGLLPKVWPFNTSLFYPFHMWNLFCSLLHHSVLKWEKRRKNRGQYLTMHNKRKP